MISQEEDDELLQDFMIEAGEILEQLTQQVVDLEKSPDDREIINAVFRGFHTIKGGASFLSLEPMVALCHRTEDVFNAIRNGERAVNADVMDIVLPVIDILKEQFTELSAGEKLEDPDASILRKLDELTENPAKVVPRGAPPVKKRNTKISNKKKKKKKSASGDSSNKKESNAAQENQKIVVKSSKGDSGDQSNDDLQDEFDAILDQYQNSTKGTDSGLSQADEGLSHSNSSDDDITEEEFERLLDSFSPRKNVQSVEAETESKTINNEKNIPEKQQTVKPRKLAEPNITPVKFRQSTPVDQRPEIQMQGLAGESEALNARKRAAIKDAAQPETTVRVDTRRLDDIMNLVGELVLVRNRITSLESVIESEEMSKVVGNLDVVTADLQSAVMKTRMQPIKKVFGRFPRVVRDLARSLKKEISLELQGEDTDLDKNLVEALADPLVHLVRNSVDHGIESPDEREAVGKPRKGTIILTAEQEGDHILLTIQDDGKGMDADRIRQIAVEKGLLDDESAARLDDREAYSLIFQPGFSTKSEISDVSGRGVGMDVVKTRIEQLNGSVEVDSEKGQGSKIIIKVPLTLAIMPTLMVMLDKQIFALPLASVNEIFHLDLTRTNRINGQLVVMVRNKTLPLFYLRHWLIKGAKDTELPKEGHVVVVSMGVQRIGFVVDKLIGQEEVVIKPLGALLHGMKGMAGATITGDGRISLILDIPGMMQSYTRRI
jgi:two-component system chemotaxis sensor kinase CheA